MKKKRKREEKKKSEKVTDRLIHSEGSVFGKGFCRKDRMEGVKVREKKRINMKENCTGARC